MTVASTLTLTDSRWRLLNRLDDAGPTPVSAAALLTEQAAPPDDLHWLAEANLVTATLPGSGTRLDLADHLTHAGAAAAIALTLNGRGRKAVQAPQNRALRQLASQPELPLHTLLADAGIDASAAETLCRRQLLAATIRATGATITADELALLPAATVTVRLTDKGRTYLPRPAALQETPMSTTPPARPGHYNADQPRATDGKWIKVEDKLGYADDETCFATDRVTGTGQVPTDLALIQYPDDGINQTGAFVSVATSPNGFNPATGTEEETGNIYCAPQLGPDEAEATAGHLEALAEILESGFRPPEPTKHTRARQRIELLLQENRVGRRDRIMVGEEDDFPLTAAELLKLLSEADPTLSAPQTRHAVRAHAAVAAGGEDGTVWLDLEPDSAGAMHIVVTAVEGTESPDSDYNRQYAALHTTDSARELAAKLRAFAGAARRRDSDR